MRYILLTFLLLACVKDKTAPPPFVGTWRYEIVVSGIACRTTLEIFEAGTFSMLWECFDGWEWQPGSSNIGQWTQPETTRIQFNYQTCREYAGGNITDVPCPGPELFTYSIAGNALTLTDPGGVSVTYTKQ